MRVVVLGGAGDMGSHAVRLLAQEPSVHELVVADKNVDRARRLVEELQSGAGASRAPADRPLHLEVRGLDAFDPAQVRRALEGADVAASALGPFYLFERRLLEQAIAAGVPYVSLCDDHDAARAALQLSPEAERRSVTAVTGLGWTPGLSNLLARLAAESITRAERVYVAWAGSSGDSRGFAVVLHTIHIYTGMVPSFRAGQPVWVKAGSEPEWVEFPAPLGRVEVRHVGHPEPVTLPRYLAGVREVTLKGGLTELSLGRLAVAVGRSGLTRTHRGRHFIASAIKPLLPYLERIGPRGVALSGVVVRVEGDCEGAPCTATAGAVGHMSDLTATPLVVGTVLIGSGRVRRPGVHAPEADELFGIPGFIDELRRRGLAIEGPKVRSKAGVAPAG